MASFRSVLSIIFVSLSQAWFIKRRQLCISKASCGSCTNYKSWSGSSCRWCPQDNKCHAHGALLTNPCSRSQNIVNEARCRNIRVRYDPNLAYKMVFLSALAYADNVGNFIPKATEVNTFRLRKQVTKSCPGHAHCSGFVAISSTERAIAIAFRGSQHTDQVRHEGISILIKPKVSFTTGGKVQRYFKEAFVTVWRDLKSTVYYLIHNYPSYKVWVTGHSLGGAMASLASSTLAHEGRTTKNNLILYTFGQPRVGNYNYALAHDRLVPITFRVTRYRDPVVNFPTCRKVPGTKICFAPFGGPYHHGKEIFYRQKKNMSKSSSYIECNSKPHNEDPNCSNRFSSLLKCISPSSFKKCVNNHVTYFQVDIGTWWTRNRS